MLAMSFSKERQHIRQVIEEQFKRMESGPPAPLQVAGAVPANSGELPTVHPPRGTDSRIVEPFEGTTTKGVSTVAAIAQEPKRPRLVVWGVIAATALTAVASIGVRAFSPRPKVESPTDVASATAQGDNHGSSTAAHQGASPGDTATTSPASAPRVGVGDEQRDEGASRHDDGTNGNASRGGASTLHTDRGHPSGTTHDMASAMAAAAPLDAGVAAAPPATAADPLPLRTTPTKPKVQLERDNPWP
jgi:hypothetical protein